MSDPVSTSDPRVEAAGAREQAKVALKALIEHFMYSERGVHQVATEAYREWEADRD